MNNINVVVIDVDGTLTTSENKITNKTKDILMKVQGLEMILILA